MLWPLSWDDDNWRSMFHILNMNNHDPSVFMRRCKLTEHVSYMNDILQCSDPCHAMKTTDRACFTPYGWISMLWPLSWDDDNWRSIFLTWMIYYYALTVVIWWWQLTEHGSYLRYDKPCSLRVMRRWKLTEHVSYMNDILPCSDPCHAMKTTDRACFTPYGWIPILWPLSWDDDNWRSLFLTWMVYSYALTVGMRWWQLTEHGSYLRYD